MAVPIPLSQPADPSLVAQSRRVSRQITRRHARSFYVASFALPREKRDAAYAVYAFCRHVDDTADRSLEPFPLGVRLQAIQEDLDRMFRGQSVSLQFAPAFTWAVRRFRIEKRPFLELLEGVGRDEGEVRIADWPSLRSYCYHVASVVGLIMARIFEIRNSTAEERAVELGIAMQLTHILRDVGEDYANGRVYLPATELSEFGLNDSDIASGFVTLPFIEFMKMQIARARGFYASADPGIPEVRDDGSQFSVRLMSVLYSAILDEIERNRYDVFHTRATVPIPRKLLLAWRAWQLYRAGHRR